MTSTSSDGATPRLSISLADAEPPPVASFGPAPGPSIRLRRGVIALAVTVLVVATAPLVLRGGPTGPPSLQRRQRLQPLRCWNRRCLDVSATPRRVLRRYVWLQPTRADHVGESWTASGWSSDRYQQEPGQVDRLWLLDVGGQRPVVDAWYLPTATAQDRAELENVVHSIRFLESP